MALSDDLAPLRALVEATDLHTYRAYHVLSFSDPPSYHEGEPGSRLEDCPQCLDRRDERLALFLPAAREALERVDEILLKDGGKTNEINILTKENCEQATRLARVERDLGEVLDIVRVQAPDVYEALDEARRAAGIPDEADSQ